MLRTTLLLIALVGYMDGFAQLNLTLLAHRPNDTLVTLAGCWHHVDASGREYALVGTRLGLDIYDLTNPTDPQRIHQVPGRVSNWREVCTWANHAYIGSEADSSGITIVDLVHLPDSIRYHVWTGSDTLAGRIQRSHTVRAENGYLYVFGSRSPFDGAIICDLTNPWEPVLAGLYQQNYVHDGLIRGDTLWTSEIYAGQFAVVDISDPLTPTVLVTQPTPARFNHNTDLSPDSRTIFTTDELNNAPLGAFDVSDLDNITQLDLYKPTQRPAAPVHNVRVMGDNYLVCPSYGGQLTIVDASEPDNLIETAWYLMGQTLVWDADPYLPSGILFATAKGEGFYVFQPTYQRAARLRGLVTDSLTQQPIINARITLLNTLHGDSTRINGTYATGTAQPGIYQVLFERDGYQSRQFDGVTLLSGQTTLLDVALVPDSSVSVTQVPQVVPLVRPTLVREGFFVSVAPDVAGMMNVEMSQIQVFDPLGALVCTQPWPAGAAEVWVPLPAGIPAGNYRVCIRQRTGVPSVVTTVTVVR
jgi:choice-of-anchor B domain-containing protein